MDDETKEPIASTRKSRTPQSTQQNVQRTSGLLDVGAVLFVNPEADLDEFIGTAPRMKTLCESLTVYFDNNDGALKWAEIANRRPQCSEITRPSLGRSILTPILSPHGDLLDVDFINGTSVSSNVHKLRHSYFSLSREVIEDTRELIVTSKRAFDRHARLAVREQINPACPIQQQHRDTQTMIGYNCASSSNIFDFLVAPSFVK